MTIHFIAAAQRHQHATMNVLEKYPNSIFLRGLPEDSEFPPVRERIVELFRYLDGLEDPHFEQELADKDRFQIHRT